MNLVVDLVLNLIGASASMLFFTSSVLCPQSFKPSYPWNNYWFMIILGSYLMPLFLIKTGILYSNSLLSPGGQISHINSEVIFFLNFFSTMSIIIFGMCYNYFYPKKFEDLKGYVQKLQNEKKGLKGYLQKLQNEQTILHSKLKHELDKAK